MRDSGSLAAPSFFSSWVARRQQWQPGGASPVALLCCERGRFVYIGRDLGSDKKQGAPPPVVGHRGEKIRAHANVGPPFDLFLSCIRASTR
jgi:hypothetical protein